MTDFAYLWWEINRINVTKEEKELAIKKYIARSLTTEEQTKALHEYMQEKNDEK
tara:strand:- start:175 stop:336 length:162 start_codon:yes stop_codon:yes gene_type:complete